MGYRGYWGYYEPSKPIEVEGGIKTRSKRGEIGETWWSKRWINILKSFDMGARLTRGLSYARRGQVISIDVKPGVVAAKVQGSRPRPYSVEIKLSPLSKKEWDKVTEAMASKAIFAAKLLAGEMPKNIEEAFNDVDISLFPTSMDDLETDCSCPDWANPCKHIAAVYYLLADRFDEDPFLIFKLRGRDKEAITGALGKKRPMIPVAGTTPHARGGNEAGAGCGTTFPLEECLDSFWRAGEGLETFSVNFAQVDVENAVLRILGEAPFNVGRRNVSKILEKAYEVASRDARNKALHEKLE